MVSISDQILACNDVASEFVKCPEWEVDLWIRSVSAADREAWEATLTSNNGQANCTEGARCRFLVKCIYGSDGNRVFTDDEAPALNQKSSLVIDRLWEAANRLNAVTPGQAQELAGN